MSVLRSSANPAYGAISDVTSWIPFWTRVGIVAALFKAASVVSVILSRVHCAFDQLMVIIIALFMYTALFMLLSSWHPIVRDLLVYLMNAE